MESVSQIVWEVDRAQRRAARAAEKEHKLKIKLHELKFAKNAVSQYNNYIESLVSVHKYCSAQVDWNKILEGPEVAKPVNQKKRELKVLEQMDKYRPGLFDRIFGLSKGKLRKLEIRLGYAIQKDRDDYEEELASYEDELKLREIAKGVINNNIESIKAALEYYDPFRDIAGLGFSVKLSFYTDLVDAELYINLKEVIPDFVRTETSAGKLFEGKMAVSKYHELYQDHVCSALIRVCREIFAVAPVKYVRANAMAPIANRETGRFDRMPIVSVLIPRQTLGELNLENIDPSDSFNHFLHNMKFQAVNGFSAVEKIEIPSG